MQQISKTYSKMDEKFEGSLRTNIFERIGVARHSQKSIPKYIKICPKKLPKSSSGGLWGDLGMLFNVKTPLRCFQDISGTRLGDILESVLGRPGDGLDRLEERLGAS